MADVDLSDLPNPVIEELDLAGQVTSAVADVLLPNKTTEIKSGCWTSLFTNYICLRLCCRKSSKKTCKWHLF